MRPAVLVAPALVVVLGACGTSGPPSEALGAAPAPPDAAPAAEAAGAPDPAARLARAPAATMAAGSARTSAVATLTGLAGRPDPLVLPAEGVIDFAGGRSRSSLDLRAVAPTTGDATVDTVVAGGVTYVRAPALQLEVDPARPWARIDSAAAATPGGAGGSGLDRLGSLATADAGAPIALLAGLDPSTATATASTDGDGALTTITGRVDLAAAATAAAGAPTDPDASADLDAFLERLGATWLDLEVDLDAVDRIHRIATTHDVPTPLGPVRQRLEVRYRDFGAPVEVAVPPPDQVRDGP